METYEKLIDWAQEQGVQLHGVAPQPIPGRGVGIIATKPLKVSISPSHLTHTFD
jgi:hypothetical protein